MNIHQLRCAVTVARLGSQTRAAEELVGRAISDLQTMGGTFDPPESDGVTATTASILTRSDKKYLEYNLYMFISILCFKKQYYYSAGVPTIKPYLTPELSVITMNTTSCSTKAPPIHILMTEPSLFTSIISS